MKNLKDLIQEKLHINKNTKPVTELDIEGETIFTQEEIDEIYDFGCSLKINPVIITNKYVKSPENLLAKENDVIFLHFYDKWETILAYDMVQKDKDTQDKIIVIRFSKVYGKYSYNCLTSKHDWLYIGASSVNSCKEAIDCIKNDFTKNYKNYI